MKGRPANIETGGRSNSLRMTPTDVAIDPEEARHRHADGELVLVDIRREEERDEMKIPGSLHAPWGEFDDHVEEIPSDGIVVFHCSRGERASRARERFEATRDADARHLRGGIVAWAERGFPVEREDG